MREPLVTVIVPVYNVEKFLHKCVETIVNQTYRNLEIILVDDGSPDNCPALCDEWAARDERITVLHKKNGGLSSARNAGLEVAKGEYLCFLDSDDYLDIQTIELAVNRIIVDKTDLVIYNLQYCDEDGTPVKKGFGDTSRLKALWSEDDFWELFFSGYDALCVVAWNKIYKRELFDGVRFPDGRIHEDQFVIQHIVSRCSSISYIDKRLYWYVQRSGSIMANRNAGTDIDQALAYLWRFDYLLASGRRTSAEKTFSTADTIERKLRKKKKEFNETQSAEYFQIPKLLNRAYQRLQVSEPILKRRLVRFLSFRMRPVYSILTGAITFLRRIRKYSASKL